MQELWNSLLFVDKVTIVTSVITTLAVVIGSFAAVYQIIKQRNDRLNEFKYQKLTDIHDKRNKLLSNCFTSMVQAVPYWKSSAKEYHKDIIDRINLIIKTRNELDLEGDINLTEKNTGCLSKDKRKQNLIVQKTKVNKIYKGKCTLFLEALNEIRDLSSYSADYEETINRLDNMLQESNTINDCKEIAKVKILQNEKYLKGMEPVNLKVKELNKEVIELYNNFYKELEKLKKIDNEYIEYQYKNGFKKPVKCKVCSNLEPTNNDQKK